VAVLVAVLVPFPAVAQTGEPGVEVTVPPPPPPREFGLEPTAPPERSQIREQEFYPGLVRSTHDPAFVQPFVATQPVSRSFAVRVGVSGWTAPALPFDIRESGGGVAFGLTIQWEVPIAEAPAPAPPSQR
jgi:hypothetical protein